ncbi:MAG: hypothetical protein VCC36_04740 [Gammaproteobacteria bacterium]|jgi:hypothetical protein
MIVNTRTNYSDITDELASTISRTIDLMELVTTNLDDTLDAAEVVKRFRRMKMCEEAQELETLFARAEELRSASSDFRLLRSL